jgi:hypothetical protein
MLKSINAHSLDWMPRSVWGPIKWKELHVRALSPFPMSEEAQWFDAFLAGLPCPKCREHFKGFLEQTPPDFTSREAFFNWTVQAHNFVNEATGKPLLDVDEARSLHVCEFDPLSS